MNRLVNPIPLFLNRRGNLLDDGSIYVGEAGKDPETFPVQLYWDAALSIPAAQPLKTLGGVIVNAGNAALVYMAQDDYSIRVYDADGDTTQNTSSARDLSANYQPLDADLTAIAALSTTSFGRSLLTLANSEALKTATGIVECLPLTGGTLSGAILRGGSGVHAYFADSAMTGGRIYVTSASGSDPTSAPGDIWLGF